MDRALDTNDFFSWTWWMVMRLDTLLELTSILIFVYFLMTWTLITGQTRRLCWVWQGWATTVVWNMFTNVSSWLFVSTTGFCPCITMELSCLYCEYLKRSAVVGHVALCHSCICQNIVCLSVSVCTTYKTKGWNIHQFRSVWCLESVSLHSQVQHLCQ